MAPAAVPLDPAIGVAERSVGPAERPVGAVGRPAGVPGSVGSLLADAERKEAGTLAIPPRGGVADSA